MFSYHTCKTIQASSTVLTAVVENFLAVGERPQRPLEAAHRPWVALQGHREMVAAETRPVAAKRPVVGRESAEAVPVHQPRQYQAGLASPAAGGEGARRETAKQSLAHQASAAAGMVACRADRGAAGTPGDRSRGGTRTVAAEAAVLGGLGSVSSSSEVVGRGSVCLYVEILGRQAGAETQAARAALQEAFQEALQASAWSVPRLHRSL